METCDMLMRLFTAKQRQNCSEILIISIDCGTGLQKVLNQAFLTQSLRANLLTNLSAWSISIRDTYRIFGGGTLSVLGNYCTRLQLQ
ncbi:hypothetical protein GDO78_011589 [Eleutherodactylus coqui]|uniref:Uncharacterized protein n=1 Tax=Eleutherodactylus coqui TaxID=57060 RepID=A0A8J6F3D9_ELECQ|nr:hypothetical protein GDO78_011589 [Eleutherodactylus coqui]